MSLNLITLPKKDFLPALEQNLDRIVEAFVYVEPVVLQLVDATSGAVSKYLPSGDRQELKQYQFIKIDASANAVTIYPYTGQTILGAASYVLAARYDRAKFAFSKATQDWVLLSP